MKIWSDLTILKTEQYCLKISEIQPLVKDPNQREINFHVTLWSFLNGGNGSNPFA